MDNNPSMMKKTPSRALSFQWLDAIKLSPGIQLLQYRTPSTSCVHVHIVHVDRDSRIHCSFSEGKCSVSLWRRFSTGNRSIQLALFRSQRFDGISYPGPDRRAADREKREQKREGATQGEDPPCQVDPVGKALKPCICHQPCQRYG